MQRQICDELLKWKKEERCAVAKPMLKELEINLLLVKY